jgi:hypothetical protein
MFAAFGVGQVLWSMIWFFLFFLWIMLLFQVFGDLFRDRSLSGIAKVLWILFLVVTPYLGVFVYLIVRGGSMAERQMAVAQQQEDAVRQYIQGAAGTAPSTAEELARLAELKEQGVIDDAEFASLKAKLLA